MPKNPASFSPSTACPEMPWTFTASRYVLWLSERKHPGDHPRAIRGGAADQVTARDRVEADDRADDRERVLRRNGEPGQQAGRRDEREARRALPLVPEHGKGRETEHRREDVGEEEGRERQDERPEA